MTTSKESKVFAPKSKTGWLRFSDGRWMLHTCAHGRIEHRDLAAYLGPSIRWLDEVKKRPSLERKYQLISGKLEAHCTFVPGGEQRHQHKGKQLIYRKVAELKKAGEFPAGSTPFKTYLVVTGQPGPNKHMEFVFGDPKNDGIVVPESVMRDFLLLHEESANWAFLKTRNPHGDRGIPVFYLANADNSIDQIGLAQMFKLAYRYSIGDLVRRQQTLKPGHPDFVETLFGFIEDEGHGSALGGRLSFADAAATAQCTPMAAQSVILNSPKPTYYPNYLDQGGKATLTRSEEYKTYQDPDAIIRGWKRYPVRPPNQAQPPALTDEQARNSSVQSRLQPLPAGTCFTGCIRLHNLKPEELGALLWAIGWGGRTTHRHAIGMGKPFGYGAIRMQVRRFDLRPNDTQAQSETPAHYQEQFTRYMGTRIKDWSQSAQIKSLLAMANPEIGGRLKLQHMLLDKSTNQFVEAKGGKNSGKILALRPYPLK